MSRTQGKRPAPNKGPRIRPTLRDQLNALEQTREAALINTTSGMLAGTVVDVGIDYVTVRQPTDDRDVDMMVALFYVVTVAPIGQDAPESPQQASVLYVPRGTAAVPPGLAGSLR